MILGLEIGLFVFGIIALVKGQMKFGEKRVVEGLPARLLGVLAVATLPLIFGLGMLYGLFIGMKNPDGIPPAQMQKIQTNATIIEIVVLALVCVTIFGIGFAIGGPPASRRRRRRREDEYDDDDRPRRRRDRDEDDEYDDRPRRRRDDDDDDFDDRPSRRKRRDEDDEDDRPRRRRRDDDDY